LIPRALAPYPSYLRFWLARVSGTAAQQMTMVALGWQMYDLTGSALDLGWVGLAQFAPALVLALPAGHLIDRHPRHVIVALCQATQALVALTLALASIDGFPGFGGFGSVGGWISRDVILLLSVVLGAVRAFQMPAQQALTPQLVPPHLLARAVAFNAAGIQGAIIAGPAAGGFVYALGAGAVYAASAALTLMGSVLLATLRVAPRTMSTEPATLSSMFAGLRFVWQRKSVLGAVSLDLFAVLLGGATALLPIFARDILHAGPVGLGFLRAAPAVGALAMSIVLSRWPIERRVGRLMFAAVAVYGAATIVFGLSTHVVLSIAALAVAGAADMISIVIRQTLVQLDTPDAMRGRVSSVNSIFIGASNQLGEFESGLTAAWFGAVASVVLGGAGTLAVVGLWMRWFPELAARQRMDGS
jgi:MFS family permease